MGVEWGVGRGTGVPLGGARLEVEGGGSKVGVLISIEVLVSWGLGGSLVPLGLATKPLTVDCTHITIKQKVETVNGNGRMVNAIGNIFFNVETCHVHAMTTYFPSPPLSLLFFLHSYVPLSILVSSIFHDVTCNKCIIA